jgi:Putative metallopeptidase
MKCVLSARSIGETTFHQWSGMLALAMVLSLALPAPIVAADDDETDRIRVEYATPDNPDHQALYEHLKNRGALEKLKVIFTPFRLPVDLKFRTVGCNGVSNAWYHSNTVSVCYEYLAEMLKSMKAGITQTDPRAADAVLGQFFYVFAHEMGHAMFDIYDVPVFGREEDAADDLATYIMLNFGNDQARPLIMGAARSYERYVNGNKTSAPLAAFSEAHSAPPQRYYNLLCLAYGADPATYSNFVGPGYLPNERAKSCKREYNTTAFAFKTAIAPHLDRQRASRVLGAQTR